MSWSSLVYMLVARGYTFFCLFLAEDMLYLEECTSIGNDYEILIISHDEFDLME